MQWVLTQWEMGIKSVRLESILSVSPSHNMQCIWRICSLTCPFLFLMLSLNPGLGRALKSLLFLLSSQCLWCVGGLHLPALCPGAAWTPLVAGDSLPAEAIYFISSQLSRFPFRLKIEQKQYPAALFHWGQFIPEGQTQWIKTLVLDSFLIKGEDSSHSSVVKTSLNLPNILRWAWFVRVCPCCCVIVIIETTNG